MAFLLTASGVASLPVPTTTDRARLSGNYARLPMVFERNQGQTDSRVKFLSRGHGYGLFLTSTEAVLVLSGKPQSKLANPKSAVVRMQLRGADTEPQVIGEDGLPGKSNYFIGSDHSKWRTNVPTYRKVRYGGVYSGIDLVYYGNGRELEYDFVVAPGVDPGVIRLAFEGSARVTMDPGGELVLQTEGGGEEVRLKKPVAFQRVRGMRQPVAAEYALNAHEVRFKLGAYDVREPLVIDPVLIYSTYLGGSSNDVATGIAVDGAGNAYVTGYTTSIDFPTSSPLQASNRGLDDTFISKLNAAGSALIYSTYLGGSSSDEAMGIAVDSSGNAYVTGNTTSTDFPTVNPLQPSNRGNYDFFVAKLNATGSALIFSMYLGGTRSDVSIGIAVDGAGNAYVTGNTNSTDFPTWNPLQPSNRGDFDAFVSKLNPAGSALVYSTYLGGTSVDRGYGIAVDGNGNVYVTGETYSTNFPTWNPLQPVKSANDDAFVSKLNAAGSAFIYSTFLGGNSFDKGFGIAADGAGNAYVAGETFSTNFPIVNPLQPFKVGSSDAFVSKLNASGTLLIYSTYLGSIGNETQAQIAVDGTGSAYVTGINYFAPIGYPDVVTPSIFNGQDAFVSKLDAAGSALVYSLCLCGNVSDSARAIAVDGSGNAYVAGATASTNFPTVNPIQPYGGGSSDGFVTKINDGSGSVPTVTAIQPRSGARGTSVNVTLTGTNFVIGSTSVTVSGTGFTIGPVNVASSTSLTTVFTIASSATTGSRTLKVTTPGGTTAEGVAFTVIDPLFPASR